MFADVQSIIICLTRIEGLLMDDKERTYFCIDMKTFYASVECAERKLNPFETNLVVADVTRGKNALCLAISPKMKAQGIRNRCRLSDIPRNVKYEIAPPRMQLYIDYSADIYAIYLDYFAPEDIHVYSIDESFIDVTEYLRMYKTDAPSFAKKLMNEIANTKRIPSTVGIGTNLFLAKVALDITAKKSKDHIGYLDENLFRSTLWDHEPITDFWQIANGTASRLARYGIKTMRGITKLPEDLLYKSFGINAELLIDHAWGRESCRMSDIKSYRSKSHSVSFSQILPKDYTLNNARIVMTEMVQHGCLELMRRHVIAGKLWIGIGYSGDQHIISHGTKKLQHATALVSSIMPCAMDIFDRIAEPRTPIRRLAISFGNVCDEGCEGYDLFTDWNALDREKSRERTVLEIKERFGKNAILRGTNLCAAGTQRERNEMIGGHRAGYDDTTG